MTPSISSAELSQTARSEGIRAAIQGHKKGLTQEDVKAAKTSTVALSVLAVLAISLMIGACAFGIAASIVGVSILSGGIGLAVAALFMAYVLKARTCSSKIIKHPLTPQVSQEEGLRNAQRVIARGRARRAKAGFLNATAASHPTIAGAKIVSPAIKASHKDDLNFRPDSLSSSSLSSSLSVGTPLSSGNSFGAQPALNSMSAQPLSVAMAASSSASAVTFGKEVHLHLSLAAPAQLPAAENAV